MRSSHARCATATPSFLAAPVARALARFLLNNASQLIRRLAVFTTYNARVYLNIFRDDFAFIILFAVQLFPTFFHPPITNKKDEINQLREIVTHKPNFALPSPALNLYTSRKLFASLLSQRRAWKIQESYRKPLFVRLFSPSVCCHCRSRGHNSWKRAKHPLIVIIKCIILARARDAATTPPPPHTPWTILPHMFRNPVCETHLQLRNVLRSEVGKFKTNNCFNICTEK